jgi:hypothetical protein
MSWKKKPVSPETEAKIQSAKEENAGKTRKAAVLRLRSNLKGGPACCPSCIPLGG